MAVFELDINSCTFKLLDMDNIIVIVFVGLSFVSMLVSNYAEVFDMHTYRAFDAAFVSAIFLFVAVVCWYNTPFVTSNGHIFVLDILTIIACLIFVVTNLYLEKAYWILSALYYLGIIYFAWLNFI